MTLPILVHDGVTAYFDEALGISFVTYKGILNSDVTRALYDWVKALLPLIGENATRGVVFDFRQVTHFTRDNLHASREESTRINREKDMSTHPVALIVENTYQEQMVKTSMQLTPIEERKRIVYSMEDALDYIEQWHKENS
ncbi:MAG: hypothetical protein D6711_16430 [Chloroflexi bacterium]|nr:MAG: hypothetical protein D6711_16430 [Chloroflexota bacterium]